MDNKLPNSKGMTPTQRYVRRMEIIEQIDEFLKEMILYCEDEEDLISMGALLQIQSKYILTAVMQREDWSKIINEYVKDSVNEPRTSINIEEILNKLK